MDLKPLHYVSQDNQPYGSVRKCCSICGCSVLPYGSTFFTDDKEEYEEDEYPCKLELKGRI